MVDTRSSYAERRRQQVQNCHLNLFRCFTLSTTRTANDASRFFESAVFARSKEGAGDKGRIAQDLRIMLENDMDSVLRNTYFSESKKAGTNDCNDVEWTQLLKGVGNANTANLAKSNDLRYFNCSAALANDSQQQYHFQGHGERGMSWNYHRAGSENAAENCFPALVAIMPSSTENVTVNNCGAGGLQHSGNGHEQLLADVFRRRSAGYGASAVEASDRQTGKDGEFQDEDQSLPIGGHFTRGEHVSAMPIENLFPSSRGLGIPSSASMQQFTRSPNHAIRTLFPEKSSGCSCPPQQRSHEEITNQKVMDEEQLLGHASKKMRRQHGTGALGPISSGQSELTSGSGIVKAGPSASYLRTSLTTSMDNATYSTSSPLLASFPVTSGRPSAPLSPGSNPNKAKPSTFQTACGEMPLPVEDSADGTLSKPPLKDYLSYNLDGNNARRKGSVAGVQRLVSERDVYLDLGGQKQNYPNFMFFDAQRQPLGQASMFKFSPTAWSVLPDNTGSKGNLSYAPWPAGHFSLSPPVDSRQPNPDFSRPRMLDDSCKQSDIQEDGNEARKAFSAPAMGRRLLIQKLLTSTDVGSLGRIILPKKEAEIHLPHLQYKENIDICMFDYEADRPWTMKYRYWPNNKSRMYLLENTGEFAKFHSLQQGDWIYIYRESIAHYVLRAKKMPSIAQITPVPQTVDGAASVRSPVAKDAEAPAKSAGTSDGGVASCGAGGGGGGGGDL